MRAYHIESFGLAHLTQTTHPSPEPGPNEVALRVEAVSLNARDLMMVQGRYNPRQPLPLVPCSDASAVVEAIGQGVTRVAVGDRVMPIFAQRWWAGEPAREVIASTLGGPLQGTLRERMVLHEQGLVHTPAHLSHAEAATLPCAALTAWSALVTHGRLVAGDTVLVQGTGGVSMFALQLAKLHGARVIATSSSDEKLARARALGADEVINYREVPDWGKRARALTGGRGVDHVVEVGGAGTLEQSLRAVRPGGQISLIGVLSGAVEPLNILPILMQQVRVQGILVGHREGFEAMSRAITQAALRPVIDRVFAWDQAREAFEHLASGAHLGKIVIQRES